MAAVVQLMRNGYYIVLTRYDTSYKLAPAVGGSCFRYLSCNVHNSLYHRVRPLQLPIGKSLTFKKFVASLDIDEADVLAFKKWLSNIPKFPASSSPDAHVVFIHFGGDSFNTTESLGYKKCMIAYFAFEDYKMKKVFRED